MNQRLKLILICSFFGFSSGLPLFALLSLVIVWLKSYEVNLTLISLTAITSLPYAWKFLWAPLVDKYSLPFLGKRRGWILVTQILCFIALWCMGYADYQNVKYSVLPICLCLAFASSTQDIVLDAYRREYFSDKEQAPAMAIWLAAYKISGLVSFSLPLVLVDNKILTWPQAWILCAAFMFVGIIATFCVKEPEHQYDNPSLQDAIVKPFQEFYQRLGLKHVLIILAFICFYKLGDMLATNLASVFYLDIGYSKTQVGTVAKLAGLGASILGGIVGAIWMEKWGIYKSLWIFGVLQALAILGFMWLAQDDLYRFQNIWDSWDYRLIKKPDNNIYSLAFVIAAEAWAVGMGSAALGGYLATITHRKYSATQFALFTSLAALPRIVLGVYIGTMKYAMGNWYNFFIFCFILAAPGMLLLYYLTKKPMTNLDSTNNTQNT